MAITKGYKRNFETLKRAAKHGDLALVDCTDKATGKPVMAVCAVNRVGDEIQLVPVAKLFDGDPYEELLPPGQEPEQPSDTPPAPAPAPLAAAQTAKDALAAKLRHRPWLQGIDIVPEANGYVLQLHVTQRLAPTKLPTEESGVPVRVNRLGGHSRRYGGVTRKPEGQS